MKRPFAVIGITYLISQAVAAYLGTAGTLAVVVLIAAAGVLYFTVFKKRSVAVITVIITSCIAMLFSFAYTKIYVEPSIPLEGECVYVRGQIIEEPYQQYGRYYYIIKTDFIGLEKTRQKIKIRISSKESIEAEYSDVFQGQIVFTGVSDENSYASKMRLLSKGIISSAYIPDINDCSVFNGKASVYKYAIILRNRLKNTINKLYPDDIADVLIAMLTGDESGIDKNTLNGFRDIGIARVLAVSGLHLTLLASAITWVLRRFFINRKIIAVIVFLVVWTFAAIAGFPMSSLRAAIMITVMLFGVLVDKLHTPLNSLGIALLAICVFNPYAAVDVGLLMSFSSTFGLICAAPELNRYVQRVLFKEKSGIAVSILRKTVSLFVYSFTASVFILPASVLFFRKVSLLSPITNLLLIPIAEFFLGIGMIAAFVGSFGNIGQLIAYPFMAVDWVAGKVLLFAVKIFDNIPGAVLNTGNNTEIVVISCVLIGVLWAILFYRSKQRKYAFVFCSFCCVLITFVWFCCGYLLNDPKTITVYDVGNAEMILARDHQSTVLIGAGGDDYNISLAQYDMQNKGITEITALVLNDMSESGASCADTIINEMIPISVLVSGKGSYYESVRHAADENLIEIYGAADKAVSTGSVHVTSLYDSCGMLWTCITCGKMEAIVCPDGSSALDCPFGYDFDAVIMQKETPSCISAFNAKVFIVSAKYEDGIIIVSQLKARGLKNVYCTGINGNIEIAVRDGRLYIGGDNI